MKSLRLPFWRLPRPALVGAALLFAAIFGLRLADGSPGNGVTFLYVLPIIIVALSWGSWPESRPH